MTENIKPGTWIWGRYGFENRLFYVMAVIGDDAVVTSTDWLTSSHASIPLDQIGDRFKVIGHTAARRWRSLIPRFVREFIPIYPRPKGVEFG